MDSKEPYSVEANQNEEGYSQSFCYTCDVMTPDGPLNFKMDNIKVKISQKEKYHFILTSQLNTFIKSKGKNQEMLKTSYTK